MGWLNRLAEWLSSVFTQESPNRKGSRFESYVVTKFDRRYFRLLYWRGDKNINGIYAESDRYPDLEIEFRHGGNMTRFAVECKWRRKWLNRDGEKRCVFWAKDRQIATYNDYSAGKEIPVFVVIGVGGRPDAPDDVYIVPLFRLKYPYATADYLQPFRRKDAGRDFFFDAGNITLR